MAGGVAEASGGGSNASPGSSSGGSGSVATAAVVRTNLATTVQVGGSIGYQGSYTIAAPSGATAQQVAQAQQAVTQDQQALSPTTRRRSPTPPTADDQAIDGRPGQREHRRPPP